MSPTFCRHNRFVDRCPICRESAPGQTSTRRATKPKRGPGSDARSSAGRAATSRGGAGARVQAGRTPARRNQEVRVHREVRAQDDGYRCELVPGLRSSEDALRLAGEIGFAGGRLLVLGAAPPSFYADARGRDIEQATWMCVLAAYLSPLQGDQPFAGIHEALLGHDWASGSAPDLQGIPLGPRTSHDPARGSETLSAYRRFVEHSGTQQRAFTGEPEWTPERRFARVFERLALPGFGRMGRYDLLVGLGRLGLYDLHADSLQLVTHSAQVVSDLTPQAAKRVFGIGDPLIVERRAHALAEAASVPIEALDLALYNWSLAGPVQERATLGFAADTCDAEALERAEAALEVHG